jgi:hypothetical protein
MIASPTHFLLRNDERGNNELPIVLRQKLDIRKISIGHSAGDSAQLTSIPANMPHVSMPYGGLLVFGEARSVNCAMRPAGISSVRIFPLHNNVKRVAQQLSRHRSQTRTWSNSQLLPVTAGDSEAELNSACEVSQHQPSSRRLSQQWGTIQCCCVPAKQNVMPRTTTASFV